MSELEWTREGIEWEARIGPYRLWVMPYVHLFKWEIFRVGDLEIITSGRCETLTEAKAAAEKALAKITKEKP